jgi:hypothetical protein
MPGQFTASDHSIQRVIVGTEPDVHRQNFKTTLKPKASDLLQRDSFANPMDGDGRFWLASVPGTFGYPWAWMQQTCFRVHKEQASTAAVCRYGDWFTKIARVENADLTVMHESISLHKFQQMSFDVCPNGTVRFYHRTGFGIHVVPGSANL